MSLIVTSLASGSSGNAFLVQANDCVVLVDAGLAVRTLERHLKNRCVDPATISGIVVSHEHHDHVCGAGPFARRYGIPIVCSEGTASAMAAAWRGLSVLPLCSSGTSIGGVEVWGFPVPHDAAEPQAIVLQHGTSTVAWAVDLGTVPPHLEDDLADADLVIVEANHDRERLLASAYPWSTKNRILSDRGHLSNLQAAEFLARLGGDGRTRTAWLAHLSANTNDQPRGVLRIVQTYLEMAGVGELTLEIAERDRPSVTWPNPQALTQRHLFDTTA